ncbi:MAG: hypothetical protein HOA17_07980 [Candidatus Melainabacteria bacterium]|jgi:hypothetical protein|nr:hypothetical protein [Candidatus Melainabacteria bacterium]
MRKLALVLIMVAFGLQVSAIDIVPSDDDLRFSESSPTQTFTVTLSDDPTKLAGKSGNIKAKLKFNKKLYESSLTGPVLIPYEDGVMQNSTPITLSLKNTDNIVNASESTFAMSVSKGLKKKLGINLYKDALSVDAGAVIISGRVIIPSGSTNNFNTRRRTPQNIGKARQITPLNTDLDAGVEVEIVEIAADGTQTPTGITAIADDDGNFEIEMPEDATPSVEYAVHVQADTGEDLIAFATETEDIVVDPVSTFIYDQFVEGVQDSEAPLIQEQITPTEMNDIVEQFEEFNPGIEETIEETQAKLEDLFEPVIENMLGVANDADVELPSQLPDEDPIDDDGKVPDEDQPSEQDPIDPLSDDDFTFETTPTDLGLAAEEIAGDYFVVFYEGALGGSNSLSPFGEEHRVSAELEIGLARLSRPSEAGVLTITPKPVLASQASLLSISGDEGGFDENDQGGFDQEENFEDDSQGQDPNQEGPDGEFGDPNDQGSGENFEDDFGDGQGNDQGDGSGQPQDGSNCYSLEAFSETPDLRESEEGGFLATVNTSNVISVVVPASEETHTHRGPGNQSFTTTIRDKDEVFQFYPVSGGFSVANNIGGGEEFSDGQKISEDTIVGFQVIIKQSNEVLEGLYGIVGVGTDLGGQGRIGVMSLKGTLDIAAGGSVVYSFDASTQLEREYLESSIASCGDEYTVSVSTGGDEFSEAETGSAQLTSSNGRFTIDVAGEDNEEGEMVFEGYAAQDASIAAFVIATDRNDQGGPARRPNQIDSASRELSFAVKLPSSTPSLSGTYKIFSYSTSLSSSGGIVLSSHKTGTITFAGTSFTIANALENQALKSGPSNTITRTTASSDFEGTSGTATISASGDISFSAGGHSFSGYVQDGGDAIVAYATDNANSLGLFLFVKQ